MVTIKFILSSVFCLCNNSLISFNTKQHLWTLFIVWKKHYKPNNKIMINMVARKPVRLLPCLCYKAKRLQNIQPVVLDH